MPENRNTPVSRRSVLKTVGAASVGTGLPAVVSADEPSAQKVYEAALRAREQTGSVEKFRNVLKRKGARIATADITARKKWDESEESDGVSTQKLSQSFFKMYMTMTSINYSDPYVDANWEITFTYDDGTNRKVGGELPADIVGLSFEPRDYEYNSGTAYTGNATDLRESGFRGATFQYSDITCEEYNDAGAECPPELGTEVTVKDYAGYQVTPDETTDPSKRKVFTDYIHTYSRVTIDSVGISSAGEVTVNLSDDTKKWDIPVEAVISEDELEYKSCC